MKLCNLPWLPIDGEPRFDKCPNEATISIKAPGSNRSQLICEKHAGQMIGLYISANELAECKIKS